MHSRFALHTPLQNCPCLAPPPPCHLQLRVREDQEGIVAGLSPADFDSLLDLRPFMQRAPYVVNEDASLSRGYRWAGGCVNGRMGGQAGGCWCCAGHHHMHAALPCLHPAAPPVVPAPPCLHPAPKPSCCCPPCPTLCSAGCSARWACATCLWGPLTPWCLEWSHAKTSSQVDTTVGGQGLVLGLLLLLCCCCATAVALPVLPACWCSSCLSALHPFGCPPNYFAAADNAKLALGRKANAGLVDSRDAPALRRRPLPFIPYSAYDPTAGAWGWVGHLSGWVVGGQPCGSIAAFCRARCCKRSTCGASPCAHAHPSAHPHTRLQAPSASRLATAALTWGSMAATAALWLPATRRRRRQRRAQRRLATSPPKPSRSGGGQERRRWHQWASSEALVEPLACLWQAWLPGRQGACPHLCRCGGLEVAAAQSVMPLLGPAMLLRCFECTLQD